MTIKEITTLRKAGRLSEALKAAEAMFVQNANKYTVGALFWCINDIAKQQQGEDLTSSIERMKSLYNDFCTDDELMQKAILSAEQRILPHFQEVKQAVEDAKKGIDPLIAHRQITSLFDGGTLDHRLHQDFGWLIYYTLKHTEYSEAYKRKSLLNQYLRLSLPRPSILHSLILAEAVKVEQNTPLQFRIRDFLRLWGMEHLRDEDWEQYRKDDGNILPSLVEKLIGVYAKELKTDKVTSPDDFSQLVDKALVFYPKSQNMPYFKATVLISQGKVKEALTYYKNLIVQFPSKFYLWNQTAALVDDNDTKIGLLCKALGSGTDDEFLGSIRLRLASLLFEKNLKENAKYELEKYKATYQRKKWNLKPAFWELYNRLVSVDCAADNFNIYSEYSCKADEFIYDSLPTQLAVKVSESQHDEPKHPGRKTTVWLLRTENTTLRLRKPNKFGLKTKTPNGTLFEVKVQDDKIVWIKKHTGPVSTSWLKVCTGKVRFRTDRNGKKYSIISGAYVGEKLLKNIDDGQQIKILSLLQKDGRWTAVAIL